MKKGWQDWLFDICCGLFGGLLAAYAYFKLKLLIDIWKTICG